MGNSAPSGPQSYPVPGTGKAGETAHYRSSWVQKNNKGELLQRSWVDVSTAHEAFLRGVRLGGDHQAMGVRKLLPDGKTRGDYVWEDYISVFNRVRDIASGLKSLGFERGTRLGVYSINRPEWVISIQACNAMSFVSVPLYDTLGPEAVSYIINQADIPLVICSADKLDKFSGEQLKTVPGLKYIISMDPIPEGKTIEGVKLMSWQDLLRLGAEKQIKFDEPKPDELCTICYTSGTTGDPKGVMLTHKNFVAVMSAMAIVTEITSADVHISYLPLAHMYERAVLETVMCVGGQVGFYSGDILKLMDDIAILKPTVFASVPRLYNRMYDRIRATVASSSDFAKGMFETAFNSKLETLKKGGGFTSFLWDSVVFGKTKARLGGRVRFMGSGAAPLQAEVQDFLKITMCAPVLQGYGMTETCGVTHVQSIHDSTSGIVGAPLPCTEFKLVDVPEMSYLSTDNPPRGEICVRGPNVFQGYFKMPDKTDECLEKDGWLHTGDIGVINPSGTLSIIDRKKNIFKLSQGEYVAAEKIENAYATHRWVQQIWVYGDSTQSVLVAVVVPDPDKIKAWAKENNHPAGEDVPAILADPKVRTMIYNDLTKHGKEQQLRGFEFVKSIHLESEPFSVENDLVTPTFKLKRPQLKNKYKAKIDAMYAELASKPSGEDAPSKGSSSSSAN